jgi:bifunctional DNA-binding transcriptional regulator/antitoxin component of YhaV-PrlF toxin-antitoxin module
MTHIKVRRDGRITLPKALRDSNSIQDGDLILLADAGNGVIIMQHKKSQVDQIADQLAEEFRKEGITFEDVLQELKRIRSRYK